MNGLRVSVAYFLPSFSLGFCGPQDKTSQKVLSSFALGKSVSEKSVREIFEKFEAAYQYYKLIARRNDIADPLDEKVVRAFWVGNSLLEKVSGEDLRKLILTDFCQPGLLTKAQAREKAAKVPKGALPHHSFHVLVLGAIAGCVELKGAMLDLCRVGWGRVAELRMQNEELRIKYKPLFLGKEICFGREVERNITWDKNIVPKVKVGSWVSFHWASACEVLDKKSLKNIEDYTNRTISAINARSK